MDDLGSVGLESEADFSKTRAFPALDFLRGVAAILVVMFHFRSTALGYKSFMAGHGYLAVDLFFALSGFVLAHAYLKKFELNLGVIPFMIQRIIRLYPLYILGVFISVCIMVGSVFVSGVKYAEGPSILRAIPEFLMLPSSLPKGQLFKLNNPAWSLFFELYVNALLAIFWKKISFRNLLIAMSISGFVMFSFALHNGSFNMGNSFGTAIGGSFRAIFSFALGIFIYRAYVQRFHRVQFGFWAFLLSLIMLGICLTIPISERFSIYFDITFICIVSPVILVIGVIAKTPRFIERLCTFLGVTSFAIYALHYPGIDLAVSAVRNANAASSPQSWWMWSASYAGLLLGLAYLADKFYDVPVRVALKRAAKRVRSGNKLSAA